MINWALTESFNPDEWPAGVLDQMHPDLFHNCLFPLREQSGVPMTPSPLAAAHVRTQGNSRHSTQGGKRLSDATDSFIPTHSASIIRWLTTAQRIPAIGGIGLYFDTKPSVMTHIDARPERLQWIRVEGDYIYMHRDPSMYFAELAKQLEKIG